MSERSRLVGWDAALIAGIVMFLFLQVPGNYNLIIGLITVMILSNCVRNHITAYKLNGKIY
ncbi:hypothetical protein IDJ77_07950 [Mucilaginibacter sp. ZT4R22]|uniref:Uncharacterized protein n=1 Tax=Mucilaginibacter pankratovii TaxID=2772110 RepID=A0ABR7WN54_9SPHI|nr:hypothetical protein [Mucilaginibacter pankratovii]MBD1363740.1 hypothetical protein [Mucilaginibacter pankratovii]